MAILLLTATAWTWWQAAHPFFVSFDPTGTRDNDRTNILYGNPNARRGIALLLERDVYSVEYGEDGIQFGRNIRWPYARDDRGLRTFNWAFDFAFSNNQTWDSAPILYAEDFKWLGIQAMFGSWSPWGASTNGAPAWFITLPFWLVAAAPIVVIACATWRLRRPRSVEGASPCPDCGYDLRATPDRCPECGSISSPKRI